MAATREEEEDRILEESAGAFAEKEAQKAGKEYFDYGHYEGEGREAMF